MEIFGTQDFADHSSQLFSEGWVQKNWRGYSCHGWYYKTSQEELNELMEQFSVNAADYCSADGGLCIEDGYHWTCEFYVLRNTGDSGNNEVHISAETDLNEHLVNNDQALKQVRRLKNYFIQKSDANGWPTSSCRKTVR